LLKCVRNSFPAVIRWRNLQCSPDTLAGLTERTAGANKRTWRRSRKTKEEKGREEGPKGRRVKKAQEGKKKTKRELGPLKFLDVGAVCVLNLIILGLICHYTHAYLCTWNVHFASHNKHNLTYNMAACTW